MGVFKMKQSIRTELLNHVIQTITDQDLTDFEELHYHAFNEDYYIIGYYQAEKWLKEHDVSPFEAISDVIEWELEVFGEVNLRPEEINAERVVNLYVYVLGEELLSEFDLDQDQSELLSNLEEAL